jgi:sulfate-transporting ATPase
MAPKGRRAKSKARITAYEQAVGPRERTAVPKNLEIYIPPGPRLGNVVIQAEGRDSKDMMRNCWWTTWNFPYRPAASWVVIGPNGAGKTTLFRMITGQDQPDSRIEIRIGDTVNLSYVDQRRDVLDPQKSISGK